jgi:FlaA1/EpsC-like NDP-sugar epimerase
MKNTSINNVSIKNKTIMVLGGSGALGNQVTKRWHKDNNIIIVSRNEIRQEAMKRNYPSAIYRIGDVRDKESLKRTMHEFKPNIIINAAAIKTVWVSQDNPWETVLTNIKGHQNLVDCVREYKYKLDSLMFISTDKACSPINVYGMSKAISEQIYVNFAKEQTDIKVSICRYGNVLNSTGSIIQVFKEMIEGGATTLPITHFEMTRFLLTLDEAIDLVEWSYMYEGSHGKIVIPKLKSMKIIDFSKSIAKLCGKEDIKFYKIPIRQGEKLHEEMISSTEYQRVEDVNDKYLMIGYERVNENYDAVPFNSAFHLIDSEDAFQFFVDKNWEDWF